MKKEIFIGMAIFALIATLTGISYLVSEIAERGMGGVNYGRVIFPFLLFGVAIYASKSKSEKDKE